ncbi:unnamed protein product, partial [Adineta steineri]
MHSFLLKFIIFKLLLICKCSEALNLTVPCWNMIEIQFNAIINYTSPYIDVDDFNAIFTSPTGNTMMMPGFWDGGQTW